MKKREKMEKLHWPGAEIYTIKSAIEKIKKSENFNLISLVAHMENLTTEQKMYLAYFYGMQEGKPTILDFNGGTNDI